MRTKTISIDLFKFDELSEKAKQEAVENLYDINVHYEWWDYTYEDAKNIGLKITSFDTGRGAYCKGSLLWDALEVAEAIIKEHGKECETHKTALRYLPQLKKENDENDSETRENTEHEFLHDLLEDYRVLLQQEYEYQTSEEAIIETIRANDYEFTEGGKLS